MDKKYTLGLYEKAMPKNLEIEEKLELTKLSGFDYMEISIDESDDKMSRIFLPYKEIIEFSKASINTGVRINSMCLSGHRKYPLGSHDKLTREKSLDIMKRALEFAQITGIRLIQLAGYDVYYENSDQVSKDYFAENLARCTEMAASYGVIMGFETMETPFMDTVEKAMKYVKLIDSPYLGVYPDIGNLQNAAVMYKTDILDDIKKGQSHIFASHLKETKPGLYRDMHFGQADGHTQYIPCIKQLYKQGVRIFTGEFWDKGEENYKEILTSSSTFLRSKIEEAIN